MSSLLVRLMGDVANADVQDLIASNEWTLPKKKKKKRLIRPGLQPSKNFRVGNVKPDARVAHAQMNPTHGFPPTYWSVGQTPAVGYNEQEKKKKAKNFYQRPAPNVKGNVPTQPRFWMGVGGGLRSQYGDYLETAKVFTFGGPIRENRESGKKQLLSEITQTVLNRLLEFAGEGGHFITVDGRRIFINDQKGGQLQRGQTTKQAFYNEKTKQYREDRAKLHDDIAEAQVEGKTPAPDRKPIAHILGGGTASGKTTASRKILGDDSNVVRIDPDELKLGIPEYAALKESDPEHAAFRVHDESKEITSQAMAKAIAKRLDLTYDATTSGNGGPTMIKTLLKQGYDVRANFVDIPVSVAMQRAAKRAAESTDPINRGRVVPEDVIRSAHAESAARFFEIKDIPGLTSAKMYDNSGREPKLIYERYHGGEEVIHDQSRFAQYQRKGEGKAE